MKKKTLIFGIAALIVAVVFGSFLTRIVANSATKNKVTLYDGTIVRENLIENGDAGQAFLQSSYASDEIGLEYNIWGGAFMTTEEDDDNRAVWLLMQNVDSGKIYQITTDLYSRPDVYSSMREQYHLKTHYRYGYYATFSPALMKDGTYEVFIYVKENDNTQGIFPLNSKYKKDGISFTRVE